LHLNRRFPKARSPHSRPMASEVSQRQLATIWQKISAPPTSCLKQVYFDTVVFSTDQLEYLIRQHGADHVLLGTDYPYDMGESDPVGHVDSVPGLSDAERRAICHDNAVRLLKLDG
jgi:aminocarboxymuconate-semialdehyde decarboxylase